MEFLPTPDLESCSLINSTWEKEALKYLTRKPVAIQLRSEIYDSKDITSLGNLSAQYLQIGTYGVNNLEMLLPKLELFNCLDSNTVKKLQIEVPLDNALRHVASHLIKIYEPFKNLRSLEFQFFLTNYNEMFSSEDAWRELFPDRGTQKVKKLITLFLNMSHFVPQYISFRTRW